MRFSLERALEGISKAGFEHVELLSIPGLYEHVKPEEVKSERELAEIRRLLARFGLTAISLSAHVQLLVKNPDDTPVAIEALRKRIEMAHGLGIKYVNTGMWSLTKESFYETVPEILDLCKSRDVILGLEVGEPGLTATGRDTMELLRPISSKNVGINYDTANIRWSTGVNAEDDLPFALDRVVHMHVKDQIGGKGAEVFPPLGEGEVNLREVFQIVNKSGFQGPMCLEIETLAADPAKRDAEVSRGREIILGCLAPSVARSSSTPA
jgi:L-ribulose-5-phosphate 3-epimerase